MNEGNSPSRTVCVVGATSFIGQHLLPMLLSDRLSKVRLLLHQNMPATSGPAVESFHGDLLVASSLAGFIEPGATVINLAFLAESSDEDNLLAARNLADACRLSGARRLVHVSTAVVAGQAPGRFVDENTACAPANDNRYETTKLAIEDVLTRASQDSFEVVILRPTAVFGVGGRNLLRLAERISGLNTITRFLLACIQGHRRMNAVSVQTVGAAIAFLTDNELAGHRIFIISDDESEYNNYRYVEDCFMSAFGHPPYPLPVPMLPAWMLRGALVLAGRRAPDPRRIYSCDRILSVGFVKPVTFESALAEYARSLATTFHRAS